MDEQEKAFLEERAEVALDLAQLAPHPAAVRAHYIMAGHYLDRLYGQDNEVAVPISGDRWSGQGRY
jgi:hypothetical protein